MVEVTEGEQVVDFDFLYVVLAEPGVGQHLLQTRKGLRWIAQLLLAAGDLAVDAAQSREVLRVEQHVALAFQGEHGVLVVAKLEVHVGEDFVSWEQEGGVVALGAELQQQV